MESNVTSATEDGVAGDASGFLTMMEPPHFRQRTLIAAAPLKRDESSRNLDLHAPHSTRNVATVVPPRVLNVVLPLVFTET